MVPAKWITEQQATCLYAQTQKMLVRGAPETLWMPLAFAGVYSVVKDRRRLHAPSLSRNGRGQNYVVLSKYKKINVSFTITGHCPPFWPPDFGDNFENVILHFSMSTQKRAPF